MYKHYIRVDGSGVVVHGFTNAFEQPQDGDRLLSGYEDRHFDIQLRTERGQYKYKIVDGAMIERSQEELDAEWEARPPEPPSLAERIAYLEELELLRILGGM